ncbi:MAG: MFS transporter [Pyrinomonadaceae bacterium]|nr:MFS transporter [Pyrinomonadaceae bacterium]
MNPWRGLGVLPREVWFLCLAILVNRAGTMVLPFLTLYLTIDRRLSVSTAGLTLTVYGIGAIAVAPLAGRLSDRFGGLRIMKLSLLLSGLLLFVFPFANHLTSILTITAVWAIANEAFRPPSMSLIGDLAGPAQRKAAFALSRLAINLGMSIGPVIGGFLAMRSFKLLFYFDGATTLLAALLLAVLPWRIRTTAGGPGADHREGIGSGTGESVSDKVPVLGYSSVLKDRRFIYFVIAMIPVELVFFQPMAAMPLFLVRDLHFTEAGYGMLSAVNTVIIILVEVWLNMAMLKWSHRHSLALGALLVGIGFGALVFVDGVFGAVATVVIWTFGEMILLPASAAYVSDIAPPGQSGAYMGLYTMGFSLAFAVGPWLGTQIMETLGTSAVWVGTFICGCLTAIMMWCLRSGKAGNHNPAPVG